MKKIALTAVSAIAMAAFPAAAQQADTDPETEVIETGAEKSMRENVREALSAEEAAIIDSKKTEADAPAPAPAPDVDDADAAGEKKDA